MHQLRYKSSPGIEAMRDEQKYISAWMWAWLDDIVLRSARIEPRYHGHHIQIRRDDDVISTHRPGPARPGSSPAPHYRACSAAYNEWAVVDVYYSQHRLHHHCAISSFPRPNERRRSSRRGWRYRDVRRHAPPRPCHDALEAVHHRAAVRAVFIVVSWMPCTVGDVDI